MPRLWNLAIAFVCLLGAPYAARAEGCIELVQCGLQCQGNPGCLAGCLAGAQASRAKLATDLLSCAATNGCALSSAPLSCALDACPELSQSCIESSAGTSIPDTECTGLVFCYLECGLIPTCVSPCKQGLSEAAIEAADSLTGCALEAGCLFTDDVVGCALQQCPAAVSECIADGQDSTEGGGEGGGDGPNCAEMVTCAVGCGPSLACIENCKSGASPEELSLANALQTCALNSGCLNKADPSACISEACGFELAQCLDGAGGQSWPDEGDPCPDWLDFVGTCSENTLYYCEDGETVVVECAAEGQVCGYSEQNDYFDCIEGDSECPAGLDEVGACEGNTVIWCENGEFFAVNCENQDQICGFDSEEQWFDCISEPEDCPAELQEGPTCDGDVLLGCANGALLAVNCASSGAACAFTDQGAQCVDPDGDEGEGEEGAADEGDEGEGDEGDEGAADEGPGDEGAGDEGPGDEGAGDEGDEGAGDEGDEGAGDEGAGDEGDEGAGDEGAGDEGAGDEGAGDEGPGDEGAGDEGDEKGGGSEVGGEAGDEAGIKETPPVLSAGGAGGVELNAGDDGESGGCNQSSGTAGWAAAVLALAALRRRSRRG